jgi:hypothetical protein
MEQALFREMNFCVALIDRRSRLACFFQVFLLYIEVRVEEG